MDPLIGDNGTQVIDFAAGARLPAIYDWGGMAKQGGLMAYTSKSIDYSAITAEYVDKIDRAARYLNAEVQAISVRQPDDFAAAFAVMTRRRPDAIFLVSDVFTRSNRKQVIDFAAASRIPAMYEYGYYVRDGGLMSYGPNPDDGFRQAARYVDQILKGAKAADLPAEQPTRYYLTINRATAAVLGLTIPSSLLLLADDVID